MLDRLPSVNPWLTYCSATSSLEKVSRLAALERAHQRTSGVSRYTSLLKASISTANLQDGRILHFLFAEQELDTLSFHGAHIIRVYSSCGLLLDASCSFARISDPSVFAWSAIVSANAKLGHPHDALMLYNHLRFSGSHLPDAHVIVAALNACIALSDLHLGVLLHVEIVALGLFSVDIVQNTLLNMYIKCGRLAHAVKLFDGLLQKDVITWNTMISGYADYGFAESALHLFGQMLQQDVQPDYVTFVAILKASILMSSLSEGRCTHCVVVELGMETVINVGSSLVDMYAARGSLEDAHYLFFHLPQRNVVTWTAMAAGYMQNGHSEEALQMFQQMRQEDIRPDLVMLISILQACSTVVGLNQGKAIHAYILDQGMEIDNTLGSALIDMYFNCGSSEGASKVSAGISKKSVITWNVMIAGCAQHASHTTAMELFEDMLTEGLLPDDATFVSLLSACSHAGNLEVGCHHFESMESKYGVVPALDHYMCMADLLGRAGNVNEAQALLQTMPFPPSEVGWRSLLAHCKTWGEVDLARVCFDNLILLDADKPTIYALMLDVYALAGMWDEWARVNEMRNPAALWKVPGVAFVEVDSKIHGFTVGDKSHPNCEVLGKLKSLEEQLRKIGHVPHCAASLPHELKD